MFRITAALAAMALTAAPVAFASDSVDRVCTTANDTLPRVAAGLRPELTARFATVEAQDDDPNSLSAPGTFEMIVVRLDADGKPVMACVDNEAAARRFLDAPAKQIPTKKAQEQ